MQQPPMNQVEALVQYLRTARFRQGLVRDVRFVAGATRLLFIRAEGRPEAVNCLFELDLTTGRETLVLDPSTDTSAPGAESQAEREAKQRSRELAGGINYVSSSADGTVVVTSLHGDLMVGRRTDPDGDADGGWTWTEPGIRPAYSAQLNPDGSRACLLVDGRLAVADLTGPEPRLRHPDRDVPGLGRVDFVSAEEIDRRTAAWWDPSGTRLLVVAVDEDAVREVVVGGDPEPSDTFPRLRYPLAGTPNATSTLWLVAADDLTVEPLPDPPGDWEYLVTGGWRDDGEGVRAVWQTRDQRTVAAFEHRAGSGWTELFRLTDAAWVPVSPGRYLLGPTPPVWLDESGERATVVVGGTPIAAPAADGLSPRRLISATAGGVVVDAWRAGSAAPGIAHVTYAGEVSWLSEAGVCAEGWAA
ncbi:MAG: dipeptidyl-peptidase 4, partial [Actinomycetota bacterium]|nr:dipeptidyl-peptidase 4 [Actinomycetota bacterium]